MTRAFALLLALTVLVGAFLTCHHTPPPIVAPTLLAPPARGIPVLTCDPSRWDHVYHADRLTVLAPCLTATGTIVDATHGKRSDGVRHEADGDTHGWLKLDPGQDSLLDAGNLSDEEGNLVFEIVCRFRVSQADAVDACRTYHDTLALPRPGTHVRMTGSWVRDENHAKWQEIHPVTSIQTIP
jgi:hypothetical protein